MSSSVASRWLAAVGIGALGAVLAASVGTATARAGATSAVRVTASVLNVRTGPSTGYSRIGQVKSGQKYPVISRSGSWVKIQFDHRQGWSHGSYLGNTSATIADVTASSLNIRSGPSTGYRVLGQLPKGTSVVIAGTSGSWKKIFYAGRTAYAHGKYLSTGGGGSTSSGTTYTVTASTLNVRSGPGTGYAIVGKVSRGDRVTVVGSSGSWKKINWKTGTAWLHGSYVVAGTQITSSAGFIQLPSSGTGFYSYQAGYRRWGTPTMVYGLQRIGRRWNRRPRMGVGDISKEGGGYFPPHVSHRLGVDVDVRPVRNDGGESPTDISYGSYSRSLTRTLIGLFQSELPIRLILFNDTSISGVQWYSGHGNHFHARTTR